MTCQFQRTRVDTAKGAETGLKPRMRPVVFSIVRSDEVRKNSPPA